MTQDWTGLTLTFQQNLIRLSSKFCTLSILDLIFWLLLNLSQKKSHCFQPGIMFFFFSVEEELIWFPYINKLRAFSFFPVCLSACLHKSLKLAITFESLVIELSNLTCIFLLVWPIFWYQVQGHLSRSNIKVTFSKNDCYRGITVSQTQLVCRYYLISLRDHTFLKIRHLQMTYLMLLISWNWSLIGENTICFQKLFLHCFQKCSEWYSKVWPLCKEISCTWMGQFVHRLKLFFPKQQILHFSYLKKKKNIYLYKCQLQNWS